MNRRYSLDHSGWRDLASIARDMGRSPSKFYGKHGETSPTVKELMQRGLLESRVFPGERGRGGEVTKVRIAYDRETIQQYVAYRIRNPKEKSSLENVYAEKDPELSFHIHRIAVLPFRNMSPDPNDEYIADGLTEELISTISKIGALQVIARTSVIRYKDEKKNAPEIGRELKVGCLLEGSVRKSGDKLRITAQLIDSQTSKHLWSDIYDREMKDVFAIQIDVAERVAGALQVQLVDSVKKRIEKVPTKNQEAHALYLKGMQHFYEYTEDGLGKAIDYFKLAVAADPNYARPYVATFSAYFTQVTFGYVSVDQVLEKALSAAFKAVELDKDSAEAHLALAAIKFTQLDWTGTEEESRIAVELDPSYAEARSRHGQCFYGLGRREEALVEMRKLVELDPLSPDSNAMLGWMLFENKLFDESINLLKKTIEMDPYLHSSHSFLGTAYLEASRFEEAIPELLEAIKLSGGKELRYFGLLGEAHARNGNIEEARKIIEGLQESSKEHPIASTIASVYLALGDLENTFLWTEKAVEERNPGFLTNLNVAYEWDTVRSNPRFIALVKKARLSRPNRSSQNVARKTI